jgi:hypothetical protein
VKCADDPLSDGLLTFSVIVDCASPAPSAQICPARGDPGGYSAEHGSQFGMFWMFEMVAFEAAPVTFTFRLVLTLFPFESVASTSRLWLPVGIQNSPVNWL